MILFYFLTGLSIEACIISIVTYLSRPKDKYAPNDEKGKRELSSWTHFFMGTWIVALILVSSDVCVGIQMHREKVAAEAETAENVAVEADEIEQASDLLFTETDGEPLRVLFY